MKYYIRKKKDYFWIHQFKSIRRGKIDLQRWAFADPVSMVNQRVIYASNGHSWDVGTNVIPGERVINNEQELIKTIFEKGLSKR